MANEGPPRPFPLPETVEKGATKEPFHRKPKVDLVGRARILPEMVEKGSTNALLDPTHDQKQSKNHQRRCHMAKNKNPIL
jgi:hypothetical protein